MGQDPPGGGGGWFKPQPATSPPPAPAPPDVEGLGRARKMSGLKSSRFTTLTVRLDHSQNPRVVSVSDVTPLDDRDGWKRWSEAGRTNAMLRGAEGFQTRVREYNLITPGPRLSAGLRGGDLPQKKSPAHRAPSGASAVDQLVGEWHHVSLGERCRLWR